MEKNMIILENGDELHGDEAMKEAYKSEFQERLQPNMIDERYEMYELKTKQLLDLVELYIYIYVLLNFLYYVGIQF